MGRQYDPSLNYFLLEAFDGAGFKYYGDEWTGREAWARPCDPPDLVRARRRNLTNRLRELDDQIAGPIREIQYAVDHAEQERTSVKRHSIQQERGKISHELQSLPRLEGRIEEDHAAFVRGQEVETMLWEAAEQERIRFRYGHDLLIEWSRWATDPGFAIYLPLSIAKAPARLTSLRRGMISVERVQFDEWLLACVLPINLPPESQEAREANFINFLNREKAGGKRRLKTDMQETAKREFGIGTGAFRRLWDAHAPASWQKAGRPKSKN